MGEIDDASCEIIPTAEGLELKYRGHPGGVLPSQKGGNPSIIVHIHEQEGKLTKTILCCLDDQFAWGDIRGGRGDRNTRTRNMGSNEPSF